MERNANMFGNKSIYVITRVEARQATPLPPGSMGSLLSRPANWIYDERTCDSVGHTKSSSCIYSAGEMFLFIFTEAFKMYLPLFLVRISHALLHPFHLFHVD